MWGAAGCSTPRSNPLPPQEMEKADFCPHCNFLPHSFSFCHLPLPVHLLPVIFSSLLPHHTSPVPSGHHSLSECGEGSLLGVMVCFLQQGEGRGLGGLINWGWTGVGERKICFTTRVLNFPMSADVSRPAALPRRQQETRCGPVELSSFFCNNVKEEAPPPSTSPSCFSSSSAQTWQPPPLKKKSFNKPVKHWPGSFCCCAKLLLAQIHPRPLHRLARIPGEGVALVLNFQNSFPSVRQSALRFLLGLYSSIGFPIWSLTSWCIAK